MKKLLLIALMAVATNAHGQIHRIRRDTSLAPPPPVYNPFQFPNYYQNNSMYINNSMENNPPPNPHAGPYTGNADYTDPTKSAPAPTLFNTTNDARYTPTGSSKRGQ